MTPPRSEDPPLAPSSAYAPSSGLIRTCTCASLSRLPRAKRCCTCAATGLRPRRHPAQPILTSGGSLRFQSPETLPHPQRPVKGACEDRSPASRDARFSTHGRLPAARRGRSLASPEPNDYRTSTSLCQVPGPSRCSRRRCRGSLWPDQQPGNPSAYLTLCQARAWRRLGVPAPVAAESVSAGNRYRLSQLGVIVNPSPRWFALWSPAHCFQLCQATGSPSLEPRSRNRETLPPGQHYVK